MRRLTRFILFYSAVTAGWSGPIDDTWETEYLKYNPDFFEGDIRGVEPGNKPRNAIRDPNLLWPDGVVHYSFDSEYSLSERAIFEDVFNLYVANSCIRFVERTTQRDYVSIQKTGTGCNSYVGRIGGAQVLSLDSACLRCSVSGCSVPGTPVHEFLHALGFQHEHCRTDRDDYVTINWANIQPGLEGAFEKYDQTQIQHLANYDYASVMHYEPYAFAVDPSVPTIIVPSGVIIGKTDGFSEVDKVELNALYGCSGVSK